MNFPILPPWRTVLGCVLALPAVAATTPPPDSAPLLPEVPAPLRAGLFAREPLVRNPCAMAFDARGRLFVGHGPQYRSPKPDTPPDSVVMLTDTDGDGIADSSRVFATGFNCIQGLAWHGSDLWVANSPDLTIVRDLDGDGEADEYIKVYTDLGNLEHGLHGLNWAPDGKLYFSTGTSKGLTRSPERLAPRAFRELWGVDAPEGSPDLPPPQHYTRDTYRKTYQDPKDDWGREGGVLRSDDMGRNLEIVSRGTRNVWDIAFDSGFNWLGTDNDQYDGDRVIMPFHGAHFGWAHTWSPHWTGEKHLPTVPVSGPVFQGSGTGLVYYDLPYFPPEYRGVWFINDWLRKTTFAYQPSWDGALTMPEGGKWRDFARGRAALYQPVDIAIGPDGALYLTGWGKSYGAVFQDGEQVNEGRVFRIDWPEAPAAVWDTAKRGRPHATWTLEELVEDLGGALPVWNIDAQDELVRRGSDAHQALKSLLEQGGLPVAQETWALWTLGRSTPGDRTIDDWFATKAATLSLNAHIQSLRIAGHRIREHQPEAKPAPFVFEALRDPEARVRFAAVQALGQTRQPSHVEALCSLAATEEDRIVFYAAWQALRDLATSDILKPLLSDARAGVRRAALLALLENDALNQDEVTRLLNDADSQVSGLSGQWIAKLGGNSLIVVSPAPRDFTKELELKLLAGIKPASLSWTTDGSEPKTPASGDRARETVNLKLDRTTTLKVALFVRADPTDRRSAYRQVGSTITSTWTQREASAPETPLVLEPRTEPTTAAQVSALLDQGDEEMGRRLFTAGGCFTCHQVKGEGRMFGPDLTAMGDKADADHLIQSMLDPGAVIAEGFAIQTVSLRDGGSVSGIFKEETNRALTLVQPDGETVTVEKDAIVSRESLHASVMPPFGHVYSPRQMADVVAWLLAQRSFALEQTLPSTGERSRTP